MLLLYLAKLNAGGIITPVRQNGSRTFNQPEVYWRNFWSQQQRQQELLIQGVLMKKNTFVYFYISQKKDQIRTKK